MDLQGRTLPLGHPLDQLPFRHGLRAERRRDARDAQSGDRCVQAPARELQVAAQSTGAMLIQPRRDIAEPAASQYDRTARKGDQNALLWDSMLRWAWDLNKDFVK
jgi:hypothetical protein